MERLLHSFEVNVARDVVEYKLLQSGEHLVYLRTLRQPDGSAIQISRSIKSVSSLERAIAADPNGERISECAQSMLSVARTFFNPEDNHAAV